MSGAIARKWIIHQPPLLPFADGEPSPCRQKRARRAPQPPREPSGASVPSEALKIVWESVEVPFPLLVADEVARLPRETFEHLKALGLLRPGQTAKAVGCAACELDHAEWVEPVSGPDGQPRFFIGCPEKGRVEVSRQRLQQWLVDFTPLARAIKESLGGAGLLEAVRPGRLWRLGRAALAGRPRELWMVRETPWARGPEMSRLIPKAGHPMVFLLGWPPPEGLAALESDAVFNVRKILQIQAAGFQVDRRAVERHLRVREAEAVVETPLLCCCR
jgi:hypothetical protein